MQKRQLDKWLHGDHKDNYQSPKVYVIGCADLQQYMLAVEYKHKLEPIKQDGEPVHFDSLDSVKEELTRLGVERAYLRMHNAYDEFGSDENSGYADLEISLTVH
ncbi:DUF6482 family protein [Vibrio sp.]|uniref:DUF6482 family protein n=1 Tax=Vibrio sp. TaxID=678 RepID=UPI003D0D6C9C